eukprot:CAMPEP_0179896112 /NCGR_PEP_ID=MMETSP0982-20121206/36203_1 /TAXON_ID=483367 /ORGANISM="non described non described, Strain CCMP 2436" /LENGTH=54 /DNA_ID=CAMNT_0021792863 /DNA_START=263 /DNA_END=424 /DNA_ORIENTATION=+
MAVGGRRAEDALVEDRVKEAAQDLLHLEVLHLQLLQLAVLVVHQARTRPPAHPA